jgi:hypothetical protein
MLIRGTLAATPGIIRGRTLLLRIRHASGGAGIGLVVRVVKPERKRAMTAVVLKLH